MKSLKKSTFQGMKMRMRHCWSKKLMTSPIKKERELPNQKPLQRKRNLNVTNVLSLSQEKTPLPVIRKIFVKIIWLHKYIYNCHLFLWLFLKISKESAKHIWQIPYKTFWMGSDRRNIGYTQGSSKALILGLKVHQKVQILAIG